LHFDSDFFIVHANHFSRQVHEWVSVTGVCNFLDVVSFEERLSFIIVHVHEVTDCFYTSFLFDTFGKFFFHDLQESRISNPDALYEHLAELHSQNNWFEET
jgi:hypothetical protein